MKKNIRYLLAAALYASCSVALAAAPEPAAKPAAPAAPAPTVVPIGVARVGTESVAWFIDVGGHQATWCDAAAKVCSHLIIPQQPNSPSSYVPMGVEAFGSGTGAWVLDTSNKEAILCVHNQMRNDCVRMPYWP